MPSGGSWSRGASSRMTTMPGPVIAVESRRPADGVEPALEDVDLAAAEALGQGLDLRLERGLLLLERLDLVAFGADDLDQTGVASAA